MSLKRKMQEWRRKVARLLVLGLLITSVPSVPVYAQEDVTYTLDVADEQDVVADENVDVADENVDVVDEQDVVADEQDIVADENVDATDEQDGVADENVDATDEQEVVDATESQGEGEIFTTEAEVVNDGTSVQAEDEETATSIAVGETVYGLEGSADYYLFTLEEEHKFKVDITEPGRYVLKTSECADINVVRPDGGLRGWSGTFSMGFDAYTAGTYYIYVMGENTFDLTLSEVSAVTSISVNIVRDTFYYEVEGVDESNLIESVEITTENGTSECVPYDELWDEYGFSVSVLNSEGNGAVSDGVSYPVGDYTCVVSQATSDTSISISVKMVSINTVASELNVGGSICGLSGTDNYEDYTYIDGHWLVLELENAGRYILSKTAEGMLLYRKTDGSGSGSSNSLCEYIDVSEPTTIYCYVKGNEAFDVTLTKVPELVDISAEISRDTFYYKYYNVGSYALGSIESISLTLDDGTTKSCIPSDTVWYEYDLCWSLLDAEGNTVQCDDDGDYPAGNYILKIYQYGHYDELAYDISLKMITVEDASTELKVGETISGLSGTPDYDVDYDYKGGHWLKLNLSETGIYVLEKDAEGASVLVYPDGNGYGVEGNQETITVSEPGIYYYYVKGQNDFSVTLTKMPELVEIDAEVSRDTYYYGTESATLGYKVLENIESISYVMDNEEAGNCAPWDDAWYQYDFSYTVLDSEGNSVSYDDAGYCPAGDYICRIYQSGYEDGVVCDIPVEVVTLESVSTELTVGETISDLSGTDNYTTYYDYEGGHWLKLNLTEAGMYLITKSTSGAVILVNPQWNTEGDSWLQKKITVSESCVYYCYVKGSESFDVTLTKIPTVTDIDVTITKDTFCYDYQDLWRDVWQAISSITMTLDDGSTLVFEMWDDTWDLYELSYEIYDSEGNDVTAAGNTHLPGDYVYRICQENSDVGCNIPIKYVTIENMAEAELTAGSTVSDLSPAANYDYCWDYEGGHWLKIELTEAGMYSLSKSAYGATILVKPDGSLERGYWSTKNIYVSEPCVYYCIVKGQYDFSVTLTKVPSITEIRVDCLDTLYYEISAQYLDNVITSVELILDDGTEITCGPWDSIWYEYGMNCSVFDANGNAAQYDSNSKYPVGDYIYKVYDPNTGVYGEAPVKIVSILDESVEITDMPTEAVLIKDMINPGVYKLNITKTGIYEVILSGDTSAWYYLDLFDSNGKMLRSTSIRWQGTQTIGEYATGDYYVRVTKYGTDSSEGVTIQLAKQKALTALDYTDETVVLNYGEWGYKLENTNSASGNYVGTYPRKPNTVLSSNMYLSLPATSLTGTLEDNSSIDILAYGNVWYRYSCVSKIYNSDGSMVYTDNNGYLANGDYIFRVTAYGGATEDIPIRVVGGPVELKELSYAGETQKFAYGTWGYSTKQLVSGNQLDTPRTANTDLNQMSNSYIAVDFVLNGKGVSGEEVEIAYRSNAWHHNNMKNYFYDLEGNAVSTDADGYIPVGTYKLQCVTDNGVVCDVPFEVYLDEGLVTEKELESAVEDILDAGTELNDESLKNASDTEKKAAVEQVLQKVEEISAEQDIAEIGAASAETAIELSSKLTPIEEQIESLLGTSVEVVAQDNETEDMDVSVKNALLSVPAGENAELRVSVVDVPNDSPITSDDAVAVNVQLVSESGAKLQLQAPVVITMKVPEGIDVNKEIIAYHYSDDRSIQENLSVMVTDDDNICFAIGSFSTLVFANEEDPIPVDPVVAFVTRMYQQCLSRDPDQAGLDGWVGQLKGGYMNGAQIAEQFVFSTEMLKKNLSNEEFVNVLYRAMMGREADVAGRTGWVNELNNGYLTRSQVTKAFVESTEFTNICSEYGIVRGDYDASVAPIEHFVTRFYTLCLERNPDQEGMYGWVNNLKHQYMNGAQIAEAFIFSDEFVGKNVSNEKYVELLYNTLLGRPSDENGKKGWVGELQGGYMTRRGMMKAFIESTEFGGICEEYGITRGTVE